MWVSFLRHMVKRHWEPKPKEGLTKVHGKRGANTWGMEHADPTRQRGTRKEL